MDIVSPTSVNLIIVVLAIHVGYHVVRNVTPALHTPLMSATNAISAIVGMPAVTLAAIDMFGGFLVTRRMPEMLHKKNRPSGGAQ